MTRRAVIAIIALTACSRLPLVGTSSALPETPAPVYVRGDTVELFAPGVVSTGDVFASSFTRDGRTVYFTKATQDRSRMQIMHSTWTGSSWSAPVRARFSTGTRQMDPHVAPDGKTLYFTAPRRREAAAADPDGDWDTWTVRLDVHADEGVRDPSLANSVENEMYPSLTRDSTLFFGVRPRAAGTSPGEIRYSYKKLRSTPVPVPLGGLTNPSNPYITPDGRVLLFAATGPDPRRRADLYVVVRGDDARWGTPRSLGPLVNTMDVEFCPQLSPDGEHLFFSRVRYDGDRAVGNDVHVVRVSSVPVLRDALLPRR